MCLPGPSDYRALGKTISLLARVLCVAWWLYPTIFVVMFFWYTIKTVDWAVRLIVREVKYARSGEY